MKNELEQIKEEFMTLVKDVTDLSRLEELRTQFLGRKGKLSGVLKGLSAVGDDMKREIGAFANEVKKDLESTFFRLDQELQVKFQNEKEQKEWVDLSLPGTKPKIGHLHLTTQAIEEITDIFSSLGFVRGNFPEVEWDYYAFETLNMPKGHAARDEWETFFISKDTGEEKEIMTGEKGKVVLTPHTSNGQVREMEKGKLPIRMMNISKVYRRQSDITHLPMFHQCEGLLIDKGVTIVHLKGLFDYFVKHFFGEDRKTRLRPHHFRFTEPSFELDISCNTCGGEGEMNGIVCRMCKDGWHELGGAGMVHPNVLKAGGVDEKMYSGFAFGIGIERSLMMKSGINIPDIRIMYKNDLRFLNQF